MNISWKWDGSLRTQTLQRDFPFLRVSISESRYFTKCIATFVNLTNALFYVTLLKWSVQVCLLNVVRWFIKVIYLDFILTLGRYYKGLPCLILNYMLYNHYTQRGDCSVELIIDGTACRPLLSSVGQ
jgi:hypothetical protein